MVYRATLRETLDVVFMREKKPQKDVGHDFEEVVKRMLVTPPNPRLSEKSEKKKILKGKK